MINNKSPIILGCYEIQTMDRFSIAAIAAAIAAVQVLLWKYHDIGFKNPFSPLK